MASSERKDKVIKNVSSQLISTLLHSTLGFISRRVFLITLGENLLGLNGVMTSVIGMLSLAELGAGEAINYSLYEPLAKNDREEIKAIMALYRKLYLYIGTVILLLGLLLLPVLPYFVEVTVPLKTVYIAFGAYLMDTFLSYNLAYSRNIIIADQKSYITTRIKAVAQTVMSFLQIIFLLVARNYYVYLLIKMLVTFLQNYYSHWKANQMYCYLREGKPRKISKEYVNTLISNMKALCIIRVASYCVSGTDNLLLSSFVSLAAVAIYDNYVTVFNVFNTTINILFNKTSAVIGNYIVVNGPQNAYPVFKKLFFANFLLSSYTSIGMILVGNEVISVWLGNAYTWSIGIVVLLVFNNYSRSILQSCEAFRAAMGMYSPKPFVKYLSLFEGILNLASSLVFVFILGNRIVGIFLGTMVSAMVSTVSVPWIVYRFIFKKSLREFYIIYFKYMGIALVALGTSWGLCDLMYVPSHFANIFIGIFACTLATGAVYFLVFCKTEEFRYFWEFGKSFLKKRR